MRVGIAAALALAAASSLHAQDFSTANPLPGAWTYAPTSTGSQANFVDAQARPQLTLICTRATHRVSIAKPAAGAAPLLTIWTSNQTRNLPASFNPATGRLSAELASYDSLLDSMAFSRGRFAVSVSGQPALVVPSWDEVSRVVEDCRA